MAKNIINKLVLFSKKYWKLILTVTAFLIFVPYITYLIVTLPSPFGIGFINDSNRDTWINFFGSIIGGGATLFGVWWTIKDQDKKRKEDLAVQYRPILVFYESNVSFISNLTLLLNIKLKNKGRGECSDIKISISGKNCTAFLKNIHSYQICSDDSIPIEISITKIKNIINTTSKPTLDTINENDHFLIDINIEYNDIFQNNYTKKYLFEIEPVIPISFSSRPNEKIQDVFEKFKTADIIWICSIKDA